MEFTDKINRESFHNESTTRLYDRRLAEQTNMNYTNNTEDNEEESPTLKNNILKATEEAVGKRKVTITPSGKLKT